MKIAQLIFIVFTLLALTNKGLAAEKGTHPAGTLPRTGQIITYDTQGNEIEFKNSGQDGELQRGLVWPEPRFIYNGDGTVTDSMTQLTWLRDGSCLGKLSWNSAGRSVDVFNNQPDIFKCDNYTANYSDWSMPSLLELAALLNADEKIAANYLNIEGFSAVQAGFYWTDSKYLNSFDIWAVGFTEGDIAFRGKMDKLFLLPVRHSEGQRGGAPPEPAKSDESVKLEAPARFIDNGDGTVSDITTNLMWLKDAGCFSNLLWQGALDAITAFNGQQGKSDCSEYSSNYNDWSLPNRVELRSLADYKYDFPAMSPQHPFQNMSSTYWTSTSDAAKPEMSFVVDLYTGAVSGSAKGTPRSAWPVRDIVAVSSVPRKVSHSGLGTDIDEKFIMNIVPEFRTALRWPPKPRFLNNDDGTSMDRITGITWLSDGSCFQKMSWDETFENVSAFNNDPEEFDCAGYDATFGDWTVPTADELHELINTQQKNSAAWLNSQGVSRVKSSGDYWSSSETIVNLYYAYVISLKSGKISNYPKSLKFFFWPHRVLPQSVSSEPLLNVTVNSISDRVSIEPGEPFTVSLYLHTFGVRVPADFWLWYDTPDGQQVWLSGIRTWQSRMTPIYQVDLFNLNNFAIVMVKNETMAAGDYTLHFAVDFEQNGILDNMRFENQIVVSIKKKEKLGDL